MNNLQVLHMCIGQSELLFTLEQKIAKKKRVWQKDFDKYKVLNYIKSSFKH